MYFSGKMHGALAVDGVPAGRIGTAEKLYFQADTGGRVGDMSADDTRRRLPGGAAGRTSSDNYSVNLPLFESNVEFRRTKAFLIFPQTALPGKPASGGGANHTCFMNLFA
jgi:hypothetical protein